jgi:hypothetical protein
VSCVETSATQRSAELLLFHCPLSAVVRPHDCFLSHLPLKPRGNSVDLQAFARFCDVQQNLVAIIDWPPGFVQKTPQGRSYRKIM